MQSRNIRWRRQQLQTLSDEPEEPASDQDVDYANDVNEDQHSDPNEDEAPNIPAMNVEVFKYVIGTQHEDDEDRLLH